MKKLLLILGIFLISINLSGQSEEVMKYRRSSLYPILLTHPTEQYSFEILQEYNNIGLPDKFDDHTLSIRSLKADSKKTSPENIQAFLDDNAVGRRMVAKWFNRDKTTGFFNVDLVTHRGSYDASIIDVDIAKGNIRGNAILEDAGEDLIKNTFVLVHDITYIDKEKGARIATGILATIGAVAGAVSDASDDDGTRGIADMTESLAYLGASISNLIAGFTVKTTSHLYQLVWTEDIMNIFYEDYWCDQSVPLDSIQVRKARFENEKDLFNLRYVGTYVAKSQKTVLRGVHNNEDVIRKVCTRALDKNIAMLQRRYEAFKVSTPILAVSDEGNIIVPIGMKEEIDRKSKFEVLEVTLDKEGKTKYKRVGVVRPMENMIWDNRYMAVEEQALGATLKGTTFRTVSGSNFYSGMLIKEIK